MEKKVKRIQKYTFEMIHYEDGTLVINRHNEGFSVFEMYGVAATLTRDLNSVILDTAVQPDELNRSSNNSPIIHEPVVTSWLEKYINELDLSLRCINCFMYLTIQNDNISNPQIKDILKYNIKDLMASKKVGQRSISEMGNILALHGLSFSQ